MPKVKLTKVAEPFRHAEFEVLNKDGSRVLGEDGNPTYKNEFRNGDTIEVSANTAEHLVASGQAEAVGK